MSPLPRCFFRRYASTTCRRRTPTALLGRGLDIYALGLRLPLNHYFSCVGCMISLLSTARGLYASAVHTSAADWFHKLDKLLAADPQRASSLDRPSRSRGLILERCFSIA